MQEYDKILHDSRLSLKAKAIWFFGMHYEGEKKFNINIIVESCLDGRDGVRAGVKELMKYGYLVRKQVKTNSRFNGTNWDFRIPK